MDRLRAVAQRKRWTIGLSVSSRCRLLGAVLVGTEGSGLSGRAETLAYRQLPLAREISHLFARLHQATSRSPADAALLAAQLAECQAVLLDEFAADIAPVWDRVLAVAVDDPGLWHQASGLSLSVGLCDAARLADLCGQNVIDAFAARDLAQDGRGRPLLPLPHWMLLHDLQKTRVLVEWGRRVRLTYLPASRDRSGASRVSYIALEPSDESLSGLAAAARDISRCISSEFPQNPRIEELVLSPPGQKPSTLAAELAALLPDTRLLEVAQLGIPQGALRPAGVALLGLLHLDQTPANVPTITGARTPRVLGRLTPGSLSSWHRLVGELASAKPSVVALRSAV
jgi:1,6-anhydro-N-acetylmuramate kinase